jgi:two-component system, LytTR family, response regulator
VSVVNALRVLLADDEQLARSRLRRLLGAIEGVEIAGECDRGDSVSRAVGAGEIDVLLLDIEMPGLSGLEAIRLLPEPRPYVIFCTAHAEHAVAAFDVGAVDYLLKPVEAGRLKVAIERARKVLAGRSHTGDAGDAAPVKRLAIDTREGVLLIDPAEISHAELGEALVTIYAGGREVLTDLSLNALEARLPRGVFVRVHRRALLNLEHVALLEPTGSGGYVARTRGGQAVEVSRQAARELRRALGIGRGAGGEEG